MSYATSLMATTQHQTIDIPMFNKGITTWFLRNNHEVLNHNSIKLTYKGNNTNVFNNYGSSMSTTLILNKYIIFGKDTTKKFTVLVRAHPMSVTVK